MTRERKKGQLTLAGTDPMTFVEMDASTGEPWPPEQEAIADAVSSAVKTYLKSAETLATGKYAHFRAQIPEYLSNPGQVLILMCSNGVVIRYERKSGADRKLAIAALPKNFAEVAALLSQNLIHVESPGVPVPPNENFGVEFKLALSSPTQQTTRDLMATRIWFHVKPGAVIPPEIPGPKPYCLLSVRNELVLEIHGELVSEPGSTKPNQPFVTRSPMRLMAGWDCIEVFPGLNPTMWDQRFAALWAENDILSAVLIAHSQDAQLTTLDPRASARRQYAELLRAFKALLDANPEREQALHSFLQANPVLLCPTHTNVWSKLPLGSKVTDFVFRDAAGEYMLVELERSTLGLFRQDGHPTAELTHAQSQISDWKRYLEDNLRTVQNELGLVGITANPTGIVVIGRSTDLAAQERRKLQAMANESPKLRVLTYDDVYESAKAAIENLLGPIADVGGSTEIYYPVV